MESWHWFVIGIAALALEIFLSTGFYLFILGIASIVVGIIAAFGIVAGWQMQALLFAVSAVILWIFFAEKLQKLIRKGEQEVASVVGQTVTTTETIQPRQKGAGELWGSTWRLENIGESEIPSGVECSVVSSNGITLQVKRKI